VSTATATATLPAWAASYIGIPFQDRGRTRAGVDCWGLVLLAFGEVYGIALPAFERRYASTRDRVAVARLFYEEAISARWRRVTLAEARLPDVLSMRLAGSGHVGLVLTPERFLHVLPGRETCVERLHPLWAGRVEAVYRHEACA
jgi:cell wall-associated NlpC family hydrolase